jgi:hypothetical protein
MPPTFILSQDQTLQLLFASAAPIPTQLAPGKNPNGLLANFESELWQFMLAGQSKQKPNSQSHAGFILNG